MTILISTRPVSLSRKLAVELRDCRSDLHLIISPLTKIRPLAVSPNFGSSPLLFTSPTAVEVFFALPNVRDIKDREIFSIGYQTSKVIPSSFPIIFSRESDSTSFARIPELKTISELVIVQGQRNESLISVLKKENPNLKLIEFSCYERLNLNLNQQAIEAIKSPKRTVIVVSSGEKISQLIHQFGSTLYEARNLIFLTHHPRIETRVRKELSEFFGSDEKVEIIRSELDGLSIDRAIKNYVSRKLR